MSRLQLRRVAFAAVLVTVMALAAAACAPVAAPAPAATTAPAAATSAPAAATSAPAAATSAPAATTAPAAAAQNITFQAGYLPQGNISFIAPYVAKEKGFYDQEGLNVTIDHTAPGQGENFKRLAAKDIQVTTIPGPD